MDKVGRSVQGINHPGVGFPTRGIGSLFSNESCFRKNLLQPRHTLLLRFLIHIGNKVIEALVLHSIHGKMPSLLFNKYPHIFRNLSRKIQEL